jgi:hypothetical protein
MLTSSVDHNSGRSQTTHCLGKEMTAKPRVWWRQLAQVAIIEHAPEVWSNWPVNHWPNPVQYVLLEAWTMYSCVKGNAAYDLCLCSP